MYQNKEGLQNSLNGGGFFYFFRKKSLMLYMFLISMIFIRFKSIF